ncbi:MAG: META domain-containing protein [Dongiaceae bacterium]
MTRFVLPLLMASAIALASCAQPVGKTDDTAASIDNARPDLRGGTLQDTRWRLITYGPMSAPQHVPSNVDRVASLQFDATGQQLSGSAGCNRFFGSYRHIGSNGLAIGGLGSTRMACASPVLAQQEQEVLDELSKAQYYGVAGDQLTIGTGDGRQLLFAAVGRDTAATYACEDGRAVETVYSPLSGRLSVQLPTGAKQELSPEEKASGASFVNDNYRFWSEGDGAVLEELAAHHQTRCQRQTAGQ